MNFMRLGVALAVLCSGMCGCSAQTYTMDNPAYVIYNSRGKAVSYSEMLKDAAKSDVLLFGELHNDPISHWLELSLSEDLYRLKGDRLVIGAEMWESDNQQVLDELQDGLIDLQTYIENSRMWPNFNTDYLPVLSFAVDHGIPFVATNVPRRYARIVSQSGLSALDSLGQEVHRYLAPLPITVDYGQGIYQYIGESFKQMGSMPMKKETVCNLVDAQAVKDATMAHFIVKNMKKDGVFFHFHGELHSALHSAIAYYINEYAPKTKILSVSVQLAENPAAYRPSRDRADYIVVVPEKMTNTYAD